MATGQKGPSKIKVVLCIFIGAVLVFLLFYVLKFGMPVSALPSASDCTAPEGYQLVTNRMAQDSAGSPVYILRGIYTTGEGSPGGKAITLPPCGSDDSAIEVINNVYLSLDGKQIFLVAGAIGRDALPLPEKPQP